MDWAAIPWDHIGLEASDPAGGVAASATSLSGPVSTGIPSMSSLISEITARAGLNDSAGAGGI